MAGQADQALVAEVEQVWPAVALALAWVSSLALEAARVWEDWSYG